jgi:hypothetical protein
MLKIVCITFLLAFCVPLWAQDREALADDPEWLALLHFNQGATLHGIGESYVDDDKFFISGNGKESAQAELQATLAALEPQGSALRCRFPARYLFLARKLGWTDGSPFAHCTEYLEWRRQIPSARAVLVFPASYLNSPSSMFGHTLLRLDVSSTPDDVWSSWALNFGADISGQDNSILYIWRGLAGGYPGRITVVPYVTKIQEYSHMENRDMWEYSLKLSAEEITRLINHLWELRDINFDYYFFDENCSFRLLELLDVAKPGEKIIDGFRLAEAPVNTVRTLEEKQLIAERVYRPSRAVELQTDLDALDSNERRMARDLLENPLLAQSEEFLAYAPERRHLMARAAWRALRFSQRKKGRTEEVAARGMSLLRTVQANTAKLVATPEPPSPERGHGTQMISVGGGQLESLDFGELRYRLTYHDLLDNPPGFLQGAQIEGLDIHLRATESENLKMESLDLIHIRSLSPRNTFVKPLSWFIQTGLERAPVYDERQLVRFVQGGAGLSWRFGAMQPYVLAAARLENNDSYRPFIEAGGGANLGALWHFSAVQLNVGAEGIYFANDEYRYLGLAEMNVPLGRQNGLRMQWRQNHWRGDKAQEFSIAWRHYFD